MATERDKQEQQIADLIAEHVTIGYQLRPDGLVDPNTIRVFSALGAAHVVIHALNAQAPETAG